MSGFGRCSLTVAIPVLSAMGVQCCPLPTAYLSTHTGGFTGYTFLDMTDELPKTAAHWAELGIHFDAVYTGFMGSEAQMDLAADFVRTFRRDRSTIFICDPVMGDHGKIYKTYTPAMCAGPDAAGGAGGRDRAEPDRGGGAARRGPFLRRPDA